MDKQFKFRVIVTLGPAVLKENNLRLIDELGPCIFRINGSHYADTEEVYHLIAKLRQILPDVKLWLDLPGNKVRTSGLLSPIRFKKGEAFDLYVHQLNFPAFYRYLKSGEQISANDSTYIFEVKSVKQDSIQLISHCDGVLANNKGLHIPGIYANFPFLFEKDRELIKIVSDARVDYLALSYVREREDIIMVKEILNQLDNATTEVIAKIETLAAVCHQDDILPEIDSILIDRGDLSCDVGMIHMPRYQEKIISAAQDKGKNIFLATQFLKNMEKNPIPSIAEEIDLYRTIKTGIAGIQLSEETAIGMYPVDCVRHIFEMVKNLFPGDMILSKKLFDQSSVVEN